MDKQFYPQLQETMYSQRLENGLTVYMVPKPDYHKTYGIFTTDFGSIDNTFVPLGGDDFIRIPDGVAHFLEHKLFEKKDYDVFELFGRYGASSNAFTSFTRTSFLFSATSHILDNTKILLDFVQAPYFTEQSVEKEKGIIAQEIQMYDDTPDNRLFYGILRNLYPEHPIHIEIAGTVDSIQEITPDILYDAYHTFYHPSNMSLFLTGNFDVDEMLAMIEANQADKDFKPADPIRRQLPEEVLDGSDIIPYRVLEMDVARGKSIVGLKGLNPVTEDRAGLVYKTTVDIVLMMLFGPSSNNYLRLYDEGIIDDTFDFEYIVDRSFNLATFSGDVDRPQRLSDAIFDILEHVDETTEFTEEGLARIKKSMIGKYLQAFNYLDYIAESYSGAHYGDANLFDMIPLIESITIDDVKRVADIFIRPEAISVFHILAKDTKE